MQTTIMNSYHDFKDIRPNSRLSEAAASKDPTSFDGVSIPTSQIETMTGRCITIDTEVVDITLGKCHLQRQSPLFRLPPELRTIIWEWTSSPGIEHDITKLDQEFREHSAGEVSGRRIMYTAFLLTCRRVWLEANHLPISHARPCSRSAYRHSWNTWGRKHIYNRCTLITMNRLPMVNHVIEGLEYHTMASMGPSDWGHLPRWPASVILTLLPEHRAAGDQTPPHRIGNLMRSILNGQEVRGIELMEFRLEEHTSQAAYFRMLLPRLRRSVNGEGDWGRDEPAVTKWRVDPECWNGPESKWTRYITEGDTIREVEYHSYRFRFKRIIIPPGNTWTAVDLWYNQGLLEVVKRLLESDGLKMDLAGAIQEFGARSRSSVMPAPDPFWTQYWEKRWKAEKSLLKFC